MAAFGSKTKQDLIKAYQLNANDTGSVELQVCLLTERINHLVAHLKANKKDNSTRNGLLKLVSSRKKHIKYLSLKKPDEAARLLKKLKLKK